MKPKKYNLQNFSLGHFFEEFQTEDSFYCKKFFGGLSIYVHGKFVAFLCEKPGHREWRGQKYKMDIWNGCLVPTSYENQEKLVGLLKGSFIHPVIEKWIYLPVKSKYFEPSMGKLLTLIEKKSDLLGVAPLLKTKNIKKKIKK